MGKKTLSFSGKNNVKPIIINNNNIINNNYSMSLYKKKIDTNEDRWLDNKAIT